MAALIEHAALKSQAHLLRSSKFGDGRTRDWSLYVFFRVLSKREMDRTFDLLTKALNTKQADQRNFYVDALRNELISPRRLNHSLVMPAQDEPSDEFFNWLKVAASGDISGFLSRLEEAFSPFKKGGEVNSPTETLGEDQTKRLNDLPPQLASIFSSSEALANFASDIATNFFASLGDAKDKTTAIKNLLSCFGKDHAQAGLTALGGSLPLVVAYELLRQFAIAGLDDCVGKNAGPAHGEDQCDARLKSINGGNGQLYDSVASNYAFTYAGLEALKLDKTILKSFPEPFVEGMAARAEMLGDTGESAPEHWDGALGQDCVHGYFTGGFQVGGDGSPSREVQWKKLRCDIDDFNSRAGDNGKAMRLFINALFRLIGMEVVHLELAQDPYTVADDGSVLREPYRMEHFGFRDGLSQPFVDMNLGAPAAGGGTPSRNRSWSPVAPGEIFLDQRDEDNRLTQRPYNPELREGGTFLVFRKLEQDVVGFRGFLAKQRPGDPKAQKKLAAQFMGRWQNGCSLVASPDEEGHAGPGSESDLNNFLFAEDDPNGMKCPLSSHIRRSNPRDLGGNNDIRRHRILRRGMSYGGPFLADGSKGDGKKRGLLFIAANAKIDLQFEVIQNKWINGGEFAGQAGLGRCPIAGNSGGKVEDQFLEAGAGVPIVRIPKFVITRGGDYFFAPGVGALQKIASGEKFALSKDELPYEGRSMGDATTPSLFFDEAKIQSYGFRIATSRGGDSAAVRVEMPAATWSLANEEPRDTDMMLDTPGVEKPLVFIGKHKDVSHVIGSQIKGGKALFSVSPYMEAGNRLLRGGDLLIGTEEGGPTSKTRARLTDILQTAWMFLYANGDLRNRLDAVVKNSVNRALKNAAATGQINLVDDIATNTVYDIVTQIFGTPGPDWLTELAVSIPFARQHVGQIYPDWLSVFEGRKRPDNPGCRTMQIWSAFLFLDIVGNVPQTKELKALGGQCAAEMLSHFDALLFKASQDIPIPVASTDGSPPSFKNRNPNDPITLLDSFVLIAPSMCQKYKYSKDAYLADVRGLLLEVVGSPMTIIPANFASIMEAVFQMQLDLTTLVPMLEEPPNFGSAESANDKMSGMERLIYETTRINPTVRLLMRECMADTTLPSNAKVKKGDWVTSIMKVANMDEEVFPNSQAFSLGPYDGGPSRPYDKYLLFGAEGGKRQCWGKDKIALLVLEQCLRGASKLEGLSQMAGPEGEVYEVLRIAFGLKARFNRLSGLI